MINDHSGQDGPASIAAVPLYFKRTYDETMSLLHEARNCIMRHSDEQSPTVAAQLAFSRETMRLTTRLTSVMAWLLAQRAVHAGEITPQHAASKAHELTARDLCLAICEPEDHAALPGDLQTLMDRSLALYARIARLDEQVRESISQTA